MTGSFGSPGQKPDKRDRAPSNRQPEANPFRRAAFRQNSDPPTSSQLPGFRAADNQSKDLRQENSSEPAAQTTISPGIRLVAFGIDFIACYVIAVLTTLTPFVNRLLELQTVMAIAFLLRDYLFQGRGIGKNLMGLKVVDAATGEPPTLLQSTMRNIILIAPFVAFQIIVTILKVAPIAWLDAAVLELLRVICTVYIVVVLPLEGYRVLNRSDGLRKGDELAATKLVESQMDFSPLIPPPKG